MLTNYGNQEEPTKAQLAQRLRPIVQSLCHFGRASNDQESDHKAVDGNKDPYHELKEPKEGMKTSALGLRRTAGHGKRDSSKEAKGNRRSQQLMA